MATDWAAALIGARVVGVICDDAGHVRWVLLDNGARVAAELVTMRQAPPKVEG